MGAYYTIFSRSRFVSAGYGDFLVRFLRMERMTPLRQIAAQVRR